MTKREFRIVLDAAFREIKPFVVFFIYLFTLIHSDEGYSVVCVECMQSQRSIFSVSLNQKLFVSALSLHS